MDGKTSLDAANQKLQRLGIQLTPLRRAVLEAMHGQPGRPSVDALCRLLAPRFHHINPTAVRNAVRVFDKMGLLPAPNGDESSRAG